MNLIILFALCSFVFVIHAAIVPITFEELNQNNHQLLLRQKRSPLLLTAIGAGIVGAGLVGAKLVGAGLVGAGVAGLAGAGLVGAGVGAKAGLAAGALAGTALSGSHIHYHGSYGPSAAVNYEAGISYHHT